ncbi:MAG: NAD(P)H-dependent amine dehydrogenase family protein [Solirubrobacterales bacterium]
MSNGDIRIGVHGIGSVGRHVAKLLLDHRRGMEVVAAATLEKADVGRRLHELAGAESAASPIVVGSLDELLAEDPDVVVMSTGSFLDDVLDDVLACARAGAGVVSPCEELAFPARRNPEVAREIDGAARKNDISILGTGISPGFLFDSILCAISGACWNVQAIRGRRVVDVVGFGQNIHLRLGIGYTREQFEAGHRDGTIAGHVGFPETIEIVCLRMGLALDAPVEQLFEPMIAETPAPTRYGAVEPGFTEGFVHRAIGRVGGKDLVHFELLLHLRPEAAGFRATDTLELDGIHPVRLTFDPGMDPLLATSAMLVNSIPALLSAPPGLKAVTDLPAAAAWIGDIHDVGLH